MNTPIEKLLPDEGWLHDYIAYTSPIMMAPPEFLLATGLVCLSTAIGRGCYFELGGKQWHPHVWALLIGKAGHNKSTPVHFATSLISEARSGQAILPNALGSQEGFTDALQTTPDGFWEIGELGAFLGGSRRDHMRGTQEQLCDLWDGRTLVRKLRKETIRVENPAITAIATARPSDFEATIGLQAFTSGFLSRFIAFPANSTPQYRGLRDSPPTHQNAAYQALSDQLEEAAAWQGGHHEISFDHDAIEIFEDADRGWIEESDSVAGELHGWAKRRGIQTLKLASLHAISRNHKPHVQAVDMWWATAIIKASWRSITSLTEEVGLEKDDLRRRRAFERARELALAAPAHTIRRRDLLRRLWPTVRKRDLEEYIDQWVEAGWFETAELRQGERGPATAVLRFLPTEGSENGHKA